MRIPRSSHHDVSYYGAEDFRRLAEKWTYVADLAEKDGDATSAADARQEAERCRQEARLREASDFFAARAQ